MSNLNRLLPYLKPHKRAIIVGSICTALSGFMDGAFLLLAKSVLEPILKFGGQHRLAQLNGFVALTLLVAVLNVVVSFGETYITQRTGQRVLTKLREELFSQYSKLSVAFFERKRTGEAISRLTNDVNALQTILQSFAISAIEAPIALVFMLGYMIYTNWRLSLFVVLILPVAALLINRAGRKIRAASYHLNVKNAELSNYLQEKMAAMRLIQTFGTEAHERVLFQRVNDAAYQSTMKPIRIQSSLAPVIEFTGMCGIVLALWFGGHEVIEGKMDAAALLAFLFAIHTSAMRAKSVASLNLMVKSAEAAAGRLWEVIDTEPEVKNAPDAIDLDARPVQGHLKFENVSFSYGDGPDVLQNINFEIKPGEVVALAGLTGSGKTTVASLVPRLYDPTAGRVTLDGIDLRQVKLESLRKLIGAVPQDVTLFHGTLRSNIAYGKPEATLEEVIEASERAHADEFIRGREGGYDAPIGERGGGFSGGQKQRISIARALLRDPKLLILDEATSSLDAESEGTVQAALNELMKGRTTLIIAHRFSTIMAADRILVLDQGRIAEEGDHNSLLAKKGLYARLFQMQAFQARRDENGGPAENGEGDASLSSALPLDLAG